MVVLAFLEGGKGVEETNTVFDAANGGVFCVSVPFGTLLPPVVSSLLSLPPRLFVRCAHSFSFVWRFFGMVSSPSHWCRYTLNIDPPRALNLLS